MQAVDQLIDDLRLVRKRNTKAYNQARARMKSLATDPYQGDSCAPPLPEGTRRLHFWRDIYRLVWLVNDAERSVTVLAALPKALNPYDKAALRLPRSSGV